MLVCATQLSRLALEELVLFAGARLPPVVFHVAWAQPKIASSTCSSIDLGQVNAVVQLAFTIGTLGAGAGASAVNTGGKIEELLAKWKEIKELPEAQMAIQTAEDALFVKKLVDFLNGDLEPNSREEAVHLAAEVASFFDASGISCTVAAFTYARCSTIVP